LRTEHQRPWPKYFEAKVRPTSRPKYFEAKATPTSRSKYFEAKVRPKPDVLEANPIHITTLSDSHDSLQRILIARRMKFGSG